MDIKLNVISFTFVTTLLSACATPPSEPETVAEVCTEGEIITDGLNMRTGPTTSDEVIVTLPKGTPVILAQCTLEASQQGNWVEIKIGPRGEEITGWISSRPYFLQLY